MKNLKIFCEVCSGRGYFHSKTKIGGEIVNCEKCDSKGYTELEPQWSGLTSGISVYHPNGGKSMDRLMLQSDQNLALYLKVLPKTVTTHIDPMSIGVGKCS